MPQVPGSRSRTAPPRKAKPGKASKQPEPKLAPEPEELPAPEQSPAPAPTPERVPLYPSPEERAQGIRYIWEGCYGPNALGIDQSKALLGWMEVTSKEGSHFTDRHGKYIFCQNNLTNREITWPKVEELVQIHLGRTGWHFNGEDIIIGEYGAVLNGQKSLISHVLADQDREKDPHGVGRMWGTTPITMEKGVKFGISEDDKVVNTLDTAQSRTLADVMYRSEYFKSMPQARRSVASKIARYAIRMVWSRAGAGRVAFTPFMTHDAVVDFLERHPRIIEAIRWVVEENETKISYTVGVDDSSNLKTVRRGRVETVIEPSRAAAVLYLMGMSATDPVTYRFGKPAPSEEFCDASRWHDAEDFWTLLISSPDMELVRTTIHQLAPLTGRVTSDEKITVIWKAWNQYIKGKNPDDPKTLRPHYTKYTNRDTNAVEWEFRPVWDFGGIDILRKLDAEEGSAPDGANGTNTLANGPGGPTLADNGQGDESEESDAEDNDGATDANVGPVGATQGDRGNLQDPGSDDPNVTVVRDPTPEEILEEQRRARINMPPDNMTPAEERAWRERIDAQVEQEEARERAAKAQRRSRRKKEESVT